MTTLTLPTTRPRQLPAWWPLVQLLAIGTMALDHIAYWLITGPWPDLLRLTLGRIALPMFAFLIAWHALHTADPRRYANRILLIALVAQLPYLALRGELLGNICFTLAAAAYLVTAYRQHDLTALATGLALTGLTPWISYGPAALLLVMLLVLAIRHPLAWLLPLLVWPPIQYGLSIPALSAAGAVALLIILTTTPIAVPSLPRYLTRWFYPAHLWGIYAVRALG
ncbi:conjugal transfer protein TraX [Halomonas sp. EGI 63088]|uniref:Conjugal transfer protein TraX n=1 Tax=Halomonas flagellata TaxID=2920385 RepID=A0ABS9RWY2_9GAMM|nr:TraX family protein [Halomonas flagellata]MCH4564356.1 conjugal transfer protein TraX [Halomonas flagellata]